MLTEILTIGSELLNGRKSDAHGAYLSRHLHQLGLTPRFQTHAGDFAQDIEAALKTALSRSDLIFICGGLGPTLDDLTRDVAAKVCGLPLKQDDGLAKEIEARFASRGLDMPPNNLRQAQVPEGAEALPNPAGTAPGLRIPFQGKTLFLLPGPPKELHAVFEGSILPWLNAQPKLAARPEAALLCWGMSESAVDEALKGLVPESDTRSLGMLAHGTHVEVILSAESEAGLNSLRAKAMERLGDHVYSTDGSPLENILVRILGDRNMTLSLAESCTGGRVASRLTAVPGASKVLKAGLITYSDESKVELLEVPPFVLKRAGAVSKDCALAMAVGLARSLGAHYNLSITGIAGPDGGSPEKPVGLVHIALAAPEGVAHQEFRFGPSLRKDIQDRAAMAAMMLLFRTLCGLPSDEEGSDRAALPRDPASL